MEAGFPASVGEGVAAGVPARPRHPGGPIGCAPLPWHRCPPELAQILTLQVDRFQGFTSEREPAVAGAKGTLS